jgi:hypothetical protein
MTPALLGQGRSVGASPRSATPSLFGQGRSVVASPRYFAVRSTGQRLVDNPLRHSAGAGTRHTGMSRGSAGRLTWVSMLARLWGSGWSLVRVTCTRRRSRARCRSFGRTRALPHECVVPRPFGGVLESVVSLVHKVQDCRRTPHVRVRLTKKSAVCGSELRCGHSWRDPENFVVRTGRSQLGPSHVDIDNVNPPREVTGSLRLGRRAIQRRRHSHRPRRRWCQ